MFYFFQGVFVAYDDEKIFTYIYNRETLNGKHLILSFIEYSIMYVAMNILTGHFPVNCSSEFVYQWQRIHCNAHNKFLPTMLKVLHLVK